MNRYLIAAIVAVALLGADAASRTQLDRIEQKLDRVLKALEKTSEPKPYRNSGELSWEKDLPWRKFPDIMHEGERAYDDGKEEHECPYGTDDLERRRAWMHGHSRYIGG